MPWGTMLMAFLYALVVTLFSKMGVYHDIPIGLIWWSQKRWLTLECWNAGWKSNLFSIHSHSINCFLKNFNIYRSAIWIEWLNTIPPTPIIYGTNNFIPGSSCYCLCNTDRKSSMVRILRSKHMSDIVWRYPGPPGHTWTSGASVDYIILFHHPAKIS